MVLKLVYQIYINSKMTKMSFTQEIKNIEIKNFLLRQGNFTNITPLTPEASHRKYYRIHYEKNTKILCIDEKFTELPYPFLEVHSFLKQKNFQVPEIFDFNSKIHSILQEDIGSTDLTCISKEEYLKSIENALNVLLRLQNENPVSFIQSKRFDYEKLNFEVNLTYKTYEKFALYYNLNNPIPIETKEFIDNSLKFLSNYPNMVIAHRDYHSRNLLLHNNRIYMIDFQDMMMGCPQYDLASLLYDAYRPLSLEQREKFYNYFKENSKHKFKFREYYLNQCLQRSFKALGTYLIQFHEKRNWKYKESILPCLENLLEIIQIASFPNSIYFFFLKFFEDWKELQNKILDSLV